MLRPGMAFVVSAGGEDRETRRRRLLVLLLLILLLIVWMAIGAWSSWQVTDTNSANTMSSNTILLDDNQGGQGGSAVSTGTAMFAVSSLEPGSAATTACIGVDMSGTAIPASMTLTPAVTGSPVLASALTVQVAEYNTSGAVAVTPGTNTNSGSCALYPTGGSNVAVGAAGSTLSAWSAAGPYTISAPVTNTWYEFSVSGLPAADTNCAVYCGLSVTVSLTWSLITT